MKLENSTLQLLFSTSKDNFTEYKIQLRFASAYSAYFIAQIQHQYATPFPQNLLRIFPQQILRNAPYQYRICAIPQNKFHANVLYAEYREKKICAWKAQNIPEGRSPDGGVLVELLFDDLHGLVDLQVQDNQDNKRYYPCKC